jgi:hypothetical protein
MGRNNVGLRFAQTKIPRQGQNTRIRFAAMTAQENPILLFFAFLVMIAIVIFVAKNRHTIFWVVVIVGGGGLALAAAFFIIATIVGAVVEQNMTKQCMTAHERAAKADAAPSDYWGNKLRVEAADEAKKCADLAARKQAEAK